MRKFVNYVQVREALRGIKRWMSNGMADQSDHTPHQEALKGDLQILIKAVEESVDTGQFVPVPVNITDEMISNVQGSFMLEPPSAEMIRQIWWTALAKRPIAVQVEADVLSYIDGSIKRIEAITDAGGSGDVNIDNLADATSKALRAILLVLENDHAKEK